MQSSKNRLYDGLLTYYPVISRTRYKLFYFFTYFRMPRERKRERNFFHEFLLDFHRSFPLPFLVRLSLLWCQNIQGKHERKIEWGV